MSKAKRILICPDSFKDCLSAAEVGKAIQEGIQSGGLPFEIKTVAMSDGGEGVLSVLEQSGTYERIIHESVDALGRSVYTYFLWDPVQQQAVLSTAETVGLELLSGAERNAMKTSSYGAGLSLMKAFRLSPKEIILFLGGSATNDAGTGIASALGYEFILDDGKVCNWLCGEVLSRITYIRLPSHRPWKSIPIILACDVQNPFMGDTGAVRVYAGQKGADEEDKIALEHGMVHLHALIRKDFGVDIQFPGAGAAGGMGGGLSFFLNGNCISAFDLINESIGLRTKIEAADIIITGEGKLDSQSEFGKLSWRILQLGNEYEKPVYIICGTAENKEISGFHRIYAMHNIKPEVINPLLEYTIIQAKAKEIARDI